MATVPGQPQTGTKNRRLQSRQTVVAGKAYPKLSSMAAPTDGSFEAPAQNIAIYTTLFVVEITVRELIIEALSGLAGPLWWKTRFPQEALRQFKENFAKDRATLWTTNIPYHPIYYVGFPDLRATIEQRLNWVEAFQNIFPRTRELVTTDLIELEFIRNKVAHNRDAAQTDRDIVDAALVKLQGAIGAARFRALSQRRTRGTEIAQELAEMKRECDVTFALAARSKRVGKLHVWNRARQTWWWFDSEYLGSPVGRLPQYYRMLETREAMDQPAGAFPPSQLKTVYQSARLEISALLERWQNR